MLSHLFYIVASLSTSFDEQNIELPGLSLTIFNRNLPVRKQRI